MTLMVVAAPLCLFLPLPVMALFACLIVGRCVLMRRDANRVLPKWLLVLAIGVAGGAVWLTNRTLVGSEGGVSLLLLLVALKTFESRTLRDWQLLVVFGFFLTAMPLLFDQSFLSAGWLLVSMVCLTSCLIAFNYSGSRVIQTMRLAALPLLLSFPIMLLLFLVMPRLTGPLWGINEKANTAVSGLSEDMAPGSISELIQRNELAFTAVFDHVSLPPPASLYWRVSILDRFDGHRWSQGWVTDTGSHVEGGVGTRYSLTLHSDKARVPVLDYPAGVDQGLQVVPGFMLRQTKEDASLHRYSIASQLGASIYQALSLPAREHYLRLPDGNPQTRNWVQQQRAAYGDDLVFVRQVMGFFRTGGFVYTLHPPPLSQNEIDQFLFGTRQGFCEHYASAMAFILRAAGLPARVVVGYQGGEPNRDAGFVRVTSANAHAWVEVWLPSKQAWVRLDPTTVLSSSRVGNEVAGASGLVIQGAPLVGMGWNRVLSKWYAWEFLWQQWVVGYDASKQLGLYELLGLGNQINIWTLVRVLLLGGLVVLLPVLLWWCRARQKAPMLSEGWQVLCAALVRHGVLLQPSDGPIEVLSKTRHVSTELSSLVEPLVRCYMELRYAVDNPSQDTVKIWVARVKRFGRLKNKIPLPSGRGTG